MFLPGCNRVHFRSNSDPSVAYFVATLGIFHETLDRSTINKQNRSKRKRVVNYRSVRIYAALAQPFGGAPIARAHSALPRR
jgi:hypothetical protein